MAQWPLWWFDLSQIGRAAQIRHLLQGPVALCQNVARRCIDLEAQRIGQYDREQRALLACEARGGLVEEVARGRLDAVNAATELHDVQVHLEDALLRPHGLDHDRKHGLKALAHEAAARPQEQVFRHLLGDGAGAAQLAAALVSAYRFAYRFEIEAGVERELLILGCDDRDGGLGRNLFERYPLIFGPIIVLAREQGL